MLNDPYGCPIKHGGHFTPDKHVHSAAVYSSDIYQLLGQRFKPDTLVLG
jgi:hypothetical protein